MVREYAPYKNKEIAFWFAIDLEVVLKECTSVYD